MGDHLRGFGSGQAVIHRTIEMKRQLWRLPLRDKRGDGDQASVPGGKARVAPKVGEQRVIPQLRRYGFGSRLHRGASPGFAGGIEFQWLSGWQHNGVVSDLAIGEHLVRHTGG